MSDLAQHALNVLSQGSKSFSFAARFFSRDLREGAALVYYWCRHCDDRIDDHPANDQELIKLIQKTEAIWHRPAAPRELPFEALSLVVRKYQIPSVYPLELLKGMQMDVDNFRYYTFPDLEVYCYRVASTVGLIMSHVMGIYTQDALRPAAALGMAMQMTNIARDVSEDWQRSRIYLPQDWLAEAHLTSADIFHPERLDDLFKVVKKLILMSEMYYREGKAGIIHLPLRPALAVTMAYYFYREIGQEILRQGTKALLKRVVISRRKKTWLMLKAFSFIFCSLPHRWLNPRSPVLIKEIWRPYESV